MNFEKKIKSPTDIQIWINDIVRPIVFTNGVFDLLHRGHATYLAQAREHGASLIVALNNDDSTRRLGKDKGCPMNTLEDRMALVAALESVDAVTWFSDDTPAALIEMIQPDVLVKGGDWPIEQIVGSQETLKRGGRVLSIPVIYPFSSSIWRKNLLPKIYC